VLLLGTGIATAPKEKGDEEAAADEEAEATTVDDEHAHCLAWSWMKKVMLGSPQHAS
jgi:hypothetical protein